MHKMAIKLGGIVRGVFYWHYYFKVKLTNLNKCNKDVIGGVKDFTRCMNTTPSAPNYIEECPKSIKLKNLN